MYVFPVRVILETVVQEWGTDDVNIAITHYRLSCVPRCYGSAVICTCRLLLIHNANTFSYLQRLVYRQISPLQGQELLPQDPFDGIWERIYFALYFYGWHLSHRISCNCIKLYMDVVLFNYNLLHIQGILKHLVWTRILRRFNQKYLYPNLLAKQAIKSFKEGKSPGPDGM